MKDSNVLVVILGILVGLLLLGGLLVGVGVFAFSWFTLAPSTPPPSVGVMVHGEPAAPEKSIPADTAGEPDEKLVEAGRQQLKALKYTPEPVYSQAGKLGIVRFPKAEFAIPGKDMVKLDDAVVILDNGVHVSQSNMVLTNDSVFFNVDKKGPVRVGEFELKKGECVLFRDHQFSKLDTVVSVK